MPKRSIPDLEAVLSRWLDSFPSGALIGVAHSGGRDSTALAACLVSLGAAERLVCLYADHGDRAEEEMESEKGFLTRVWAVWGVRGLLLSAPVPSGKGGFEAEARRVRYRVLLEATEQEGLAALAFAHTRDDQVETLLMRLFRGRSFLGMEGIPPVRGLVRRPLLDFPREALVAWLKKRGQEWREDSCNKGCNLRARLRDQLVPALDGVFPGWRQAVCQTARRLVALRSFGWVREGTGWAMNLGTWEGLPAEVKADALLRVYRPTHPGGIPTRRSIEALVAAGRHGCTGGWRFVREPERVRWFPEVVMKADFQYFIRVESGQSTFVRGRRFRISSQEAACRGYVVVPRLGGERWVLAEAGADWDKVVSWALPDGSSRGKGLFLVSEGRVYGIFGSLSGGKDWVYCGCNGPLWEWENDERFSE